MNAKDMLKAASTLRTRADALESAAVMAALSECNGNVLHAAELLELQHHELDYLLRKGRLKHLRPRASRHVGRPKLAKNVVK